MAKKRQPHESNTWPDWLCEMQAQNMDPYYSASGHAWIRFHKFAFARFPSHDLAPVSKAEERELFFRLRAPLISYHHICSRDVSPNGFLYICRDRDYDISKLSAKKRNQVRRGLKRLEIRRATPQEVSQTGYLSYSDTCQRNGITPISINEFQAKWENGSESVFREIWAAFADEEIAAMSVVWLCGPWAELFSTQSANRYLKDCPSDALLFTILYDLMHRENIESVSSGLSSVQPNSRLHSLHHFKLGINLEAIPIVRQIRANPIFRLAINPATLSGARGLERLFPNARHLRAARGALELMVHKDKVALPGINSISTNSL